MLKKMLSLILLFMAFIVSEAQLKSPDDFLGYKTGSQYTPHWKIVNYINHVATNVSPIVKLQQYGKPMNDGHCCWPLFHLQKKSAIWLMICCSAVFGKTES